jgi:hypothetical protein
VAMKHTKSVMIFLLIVLFFTELTMSFLEKENHKRFWFPKT